MAPARPDSPFSIGRLAESEAAHQEGLELARVTGNEVGKLGALVGLSLMAMLLGATAAARERHGLKDEELHARPPAEAHARLLLMCGDTTARDLLARGGELQLADASDLALALVRDRAGESSFTSPGS